MGQNIVPPAQNLFLHGAFVNIAIAPIPKPGETQQSIIPVVGKALIDTGATFTCVDEDVCHALGLHAVGTSNISHVDGKSARARYPGTDKFSRLPTAAVKINTGYIRHPKQHDPALYRPHRPRPAFSLQTDLQRPPRSHRDSLLTLVPPPCPLPLQPQ